MEKKVVFQKLLKRTDDGIERANRYFSILSSLNDWKLSNKELQLLSFIALRGSITPLPARKTFIEQYGGSLNTIENLKGQLVRRGLVKKEEDGMYRIHEKLRIDFTQPLVLQIKLEDNGYNSALQPQTSVGDENSN